MSLSAIDSIQHGLLNLRANWQLVPVLLVQGLVVAVISLLSLVPVVLVLGVAFLRGIASQLDSFDPEALLMRLLEAGVPLLLAVLAATLVLTVAFVVYCYFQGGILGTLATGERRAAGESGGWRKYEAFSMRSFFESAERLTWPIFWLLNLFLGVGLAVFLGVAVVAGGLIMLLGQAPGALRFGLGCFALLGFALLAIFLSIWMQLALAEVATGSRGVVAASRSALGIVGRRLPGVALLFLLMLVASLAVGMVFTPFSMVLEMALRGEWLAYVTGQALVTLAQWLVSSILGVGWSAALIALVAGEKEA